MPARISSSGSNDFFDDTNSYNGLGRGVDFRNCCHRLLLLGRLQHPSSRLLRPSSVAQSTLIASDVCFTSYLDFSLSFFYVNCIYNLFRFSCVPDFGTCILVPRCHFRVISKLNNNETFPVLYKDNGVQL